MFIFIELQRFLFPKPSRLEMRRCGHIGSETPLVLLRVEKIKFLISGRLRRVLFPGSLRVEIPNRRTAGPSVAILPRGDEPRRLVECVIRDTEILSLPAASYFKGCPRPPFANPLRARQDRRGQQ